MCVAFITQHDKHMRVIILSFVTSSTPTYFSTFSHKLHDSSSSSFAFAFQRRVLRPSIWEKVTEHNMWVLIFSTAFIEKVSSFEENSLKYYHKLAQIFI